MIVNHKMWQTEWVTIIKKMQQKGNFVRELTLEPPASEYELSEIESRLGMCIPKSYRDTLKQFSKKAEWYASFPENAVLPEKFREIFSCEMYWNIEDLQNLSSFADEWIGDDGVDYAQHFRNKLAFAHAGNGDIFAFDMTSPEEDKPVCYINHEEDTVTYIAPSFQSYISNMTKLRCVGNEMWQFESFLTEHGLDPTLPKAIEWIKWFDAYLDPHLNLDGLKLPELIEQICVTGEANERIIGPLSKFEDKEIYDYLMFKVSSTVYPDEKLLYAKIIAKYFGERISLKIENLWNDENVDTEVRCFLTAQCLPEEEGIALVFTFAEQLVNNKEYCTLSRNLKHFKNNKVIGWMEDKIKPLGKRRTLVKFKRRTPKHRH
jgi:hypothetical protein